jgi:hypothetical protein
VYLPIEIDASGLMRPLGKSLWADVIHLGSTGIHYKTTTYTKLDVAAPCLSEPHHGVLHLSPEGGGTTVYRKPEDAELWRERLSIWASCYGGWPVRDIR